MDYCFHYEASESSLGSETFNLHLFWPSFIIHGKAPCKSPPAENWHGEILQQIPFCQREPYYKTKSPLPLKT